MITDALKERPVDQHLFRGLLAVKEVNRFTSGSDFDIDTDSGKVFNLFGNIDKPEA